MCEGLQISNIILFRNVKKQGGPKREALTTTVFRLRGFFFLFLDFCCFTSETWIHILCAPFFLLLLLFPRPRLAECYPRRHPEATGCASNSWLMALSWPLCRRMLSPSSSRGHRLNFMESRNQQHPLFSHIGLSSYNLEINIILCFHILS